jgi:hypothetical protein
VTDRELAYQEFFQGILDELREKHRFTNAKAAQPQGWYSFKSGTRGILYSATFASGDRMRAELYIDVGDAAKNKAIYDWLLDRKQELEQQMGSPLDWERLDKRRSCRISLVRHGTPISLAASQGNEMRAWLVSGLLKLKAVFGPLLSQAVAASAMAADPVA